VQLIADGADVSQIADATFNAADKAFERMADDPGFSEAVWLLTQLGIAAKKDDQGGHLESVGIKLSAHSSIAEVASSVRAAMDLRLSKSGRPSDISDIASNALVSAITSHLHTKLGGLFEASASEVHSALGELGKQKAFGELSRSFFARLSTDSLKYFLDKTIDTHLGRGQRFQTRSDARQFREALTTHCHEASEIVQKFAADWFSKNRFKGDGEIRRDTTDGFGWYAMKKIRAEMKERAKTHE
jgi:hypothetical protein